MNGWLHLGRGGAPPLRFLLLFVGWTILLLALGPLVVRPYVRVVGLATEACWRAAGHRIETGPIEAGVEQAVLTLRSGPGGTAVGLTVAFPCLAPAIFTALLLATPGLSWRRRLLGLVGGNLALIAVRGINLLAVFTLDSRRLASSPAVEPLEWLIVLATAADRLAPVLVWLLWAAPALAALAPPPTFPGRGANR
jgi:hypothetical protein